MSDPLIHPSPNQETIDTNPALDPQITSAEQKAELEANFDKWLPSGDEEGETPHSAPSAEPSARKAPKAEKTEADSADPVQEEPEPWEKLELPASAGANAKSQFKQQKELLKKYHSEAKAFRKKLAPVAQDLGVDLNSEDIESALDQLNEKYKSRSSIPASVQQEMEGLRQLGRAVGVLESEDFHHEYIAPVDAAYFDVIDEMARHLQGTPEQVKADFTDPLKREWRPSNLPEDWWEQQIGFMKGADETTKTKIRAKIANVLLLEERKTKAASEFSTGKNSLAAYTQGKQLERNQAWVNDMRDGSLRYVKSEIPEWEEALNKNDDVGKRITKEFTEFVNDLSDGKKAAWRAAQYVHTLDKLRKAEEKLNDPSYRAWQKTQKQAPKLEKAWSKGGQGASGKGKTPTGALPKDGRKSLAAAFEREWGA
jgi:hypothetical protein